MAQGLQLGKYWSSGGITLRNHFMQKKKKKERERKPLRESPRNYYSRSTESSVKSIALAVPEFLKLHAIQALEMGFLQI